MNFLITITLFVLYIASIFNKILISTKKSYIGYYQDDYIEEPELVYRILSSISYGLWIILSLCFLTRDSFTLFNFVFFSLSALLYIVHIYSQFRLLETHKSTYYPINLLICHIVAHLLIIYNNQNIYVSFLSYGLMVFTIL